MTTLVSALIILAALAVLGSLAMGIIGMVRKDVSDEQQNKMMQFRVGFQFMALILLGALFALK